MTLAINSRRSATRWTRRPRPAALRAEPSDGEDDEDVEEEDELERAISLSAGGIRRGGRQALRHALQGDGLFHPARV